MKVFLQALFILLAVSFLTVAFSAPQQFRMTWDALPTENTVVGKCQINGVWTEVGRAPGNGSITFSLDGNSGQQVPCTGTTTLAGFPDSPPSEVAVAVFPLFRPTNLRVQAVP